MEGAVSFSKKRIKNKLVCVIFRIVNNGVLTYFVLAECN